MNVFRKIVAFTAAVLVLLLGGCKAKTEPKPDLTSKPAESASRLLWDADWVYYDHNIGEDLLIRFGEDGSYIYRCDCGEPVGDSDIYDSYSYDPQERIITLQGGEETEQIQVLYVDYNYLCLQFSDDTVTFRNRNTGIDDSVRECARQYIPTDAILCLTVLEYTDDTLKVAPFEYDADASSLWSDMITTLPVAKDVEFISVSITEEGEKLEMLAVTLPESEYVHVGEYYTGGFLKLDKAGVITGVYFYGELIIYT